MKPRQASRDGSAAEAGLAVEDAPHLGQDPVVSALNQAKELYLETRAAWERQAEHDKHLLAEAEDALAERDRMAQELRQLQQQLQEERERAARQKERADHLAEGLKGVHRALFDGNLYSLLLKACLAITGATRGLYVTVWGDGRARVRAAVDLDGYPAAPPSPFIRAICARVLERNESLVWNAGDAPDDLPEQPGPGEEFHNFLAAPVVLLNNFSGVVLLADKASGDFDHDDVAHVLSVGDQASVAVENKQLQDELLRAYFAIVGVLADAVEAKDAYTHGHCELVARYGRLTAERMNLTAEETSVACYGGLLHDVGKIGVSDGILNKPGKLMPEEWDLMRSHVRIGRDLLANVPALDRVAEVVLLHHERYDGGGYPQGLKGDQIPLCARVICVVDAYCAMIAKRSYKESSSAEQARAELIRCKGTHFDPDVVDAFLGMLDEAASEDDCPDGCGLPPVFGRPQDLRRALLRPAVKKP